MTLQQRPDFDGGWAARTEDVLAYAAGERPLPPVPDVACKGLCWESCSNVPMSEVERARASMDLGRPIGMLPDGTCNALDPTSHRCHAYLNRPLICRLYGGAEGIMCPYGCDLSSGDWLSYAEGIGLLRERERVEGPMTVVWVGSPS